MDWLFGDESDSDSYTEGGDSSQESASDIAEKDTGATKSEGWGLRSLLWWSGVCVCVYPIHSHILGLGH